MAEERSGPVRPRSRSLAEDTAERLLTLCRAGELTAVERTLAELDEAPQDWRLSLAMGWAAARHGRTVEAEAALKRSWHQAGKEPEPGLLLARLYGSVGRRREAIETYRRLLEIAPLHAEASAELAQLLQALGATEEAAETLAPLRAEAARLSWPAERLHWLAGLYTRIGRDREAMALLEEAAEQAPTDFGIAHGLRHLRGQVAPAWHLPMMQDKARHAAYTKALACTVTPKTVVLEIGTGSGILAMLAAEAGAKHVYTCESDPLIADTARRIVADNGFAEKITVIAKPSGQLRVGEDLPARADLLLSELLGDTVYSEDLLAVTADAQQRLLAPEATLIPWKVAAVTCLAGGPRLAAACRVGRVAGFDLSAFNRFAPASLALELTEAEAALLGRPMECFASELARPPQVLRQERFTHFATARGVAQGLLQWNRLYLAGEIVFENPPPESWRPSSWRHTLVPFDRPLKLREGDRVEVTGLHNGKLLSFLEGRWR